MSIDTSKGHPAMDYEQATGTYAVFIRLTIASILLVIAILVGMAVFLT